MQGKKILPYGSWKSPITADLIVKGTIGLSELKADGNDLYWIEMRPSEGGRNVVVRMDENGVQSDIVPEGFNARTRIHEYGGGSYLIDKGTVYFSNFTDQRLYRKLQGRNPIPITPDVKLRYADGVFDTLRNKLFYVREDHTDDKKSPVNTIVRIDPETESVGEAVISGSDFYSSPVINLNGTHLAWLAWNHPNMPWDGTELWIGKLDPEGYIKEKNKIAGGVGESISQPRWSSDGSLYYVSDKTGWWNLYRWKDWKSENICKTDSEFGLAQWVFGMSTYTFATRERIACASSKNGKWRLGFLNEKTLRLEYVSMPYTEVSWPCMIGNSVHFIGASPSDSASIVRLRLGTLESEVIKTSSKLDIDKEYISEPEAISFPTTNGATAYAFLYRPKNKKYCAPDEKKPPLIVKSHGGPTSAARTSFSAEIQYWTSRGFAVVDVNYRGSTGYGRGYRQALNGNWGVYDVDDCSAAAAYLVEKGEADENKLIIKGGSAGGYTTLCALTFGDTFKAGASYYGISDLEALVRDTHKFESRYLDRLVGPYPKKKKLYRQRSPIHFTKKLSCPVIIFQGLEDKVVTPNQAEMIYKALLKKKIPVAYVPFEGEQHGFRKAENIKRALEAELYFYAKVFGFALADKITPVEIENL